MSPAPDSRLKVVIVGAGIAGLAAARALRAEHDVLVLESSSMNAEIGAAIHMGPNASKILLAWGMDTERLNSPEVAWYHERDTELKTMIKAPINTRRDFGAPWLLNHRVDLHNELKRLATTEDGPGQPAIIRTKARVQSVDCEQGIVTLESGETVQGDLIVGADGIHSKVRTAVLGHHLIAQPSGHSAYRCLIPAEKVAADPIFKDLVDPANVALTTFVANDRRVVAYPCRGSSMLNIVAVVPDKALESGSTESWAAEGSVDELVASYSSFSPDLQRLLSYAPSCGLWQLRDQDPLSTWTRGRAIIIGDAAHAMLPHQGQGGGQSVEDAEALGAFLAGYTSSDASLIPALVKSVEAVRIERASKIQSFSREKAMGARPGDKFTLNAHQFVPFNFGYSGAVEWAKKVGVQVPSKASQPADLPKGNDIAKADEGLTIAAVSA